MAQCRICYDEGHLTDPLISLCECKGSVEFMHKTCFMKWMKFTENEEVQKSCEMCKSPYTIQLFAPIQAPQPRWMWRILGHRMMLITWTYLLHVLIYTGAVSHPNPSDIFLLCRDARILFSAEITIITAIFSIFYAPILYSAPFKSVYVFHWLNPFPSHRRLRKQRPALQLMLVLFGFLTSFYYMYGGGLIYLMMLPELYSTHVAIIRTMRVHEFLDNE